MAAYPGTWLLKMAIESAPLAENPAYIEVPCGVFRTTITRGRNYYLDEPQTATASFRLYDPDEEFHPANTGGFVYGRKPIRKKIQYGPVLSGVFTPIYTGYLKRKPRLFAGPRGIVSVELSCAGLFSLLDFNKVTLDIGEEFPGDDGEELSGARLVRLLDAAGYPGTGFYGPPDTDHRDIDEGSSLMQGDITLRKRSIMEHVLQVAKSEDGRLFESRDGVPTWIARHSLYEPPYSTPQVTFADDGSGIPYDDISPDEGDDLLYNHWMGNILGGPDIEVEDEVSIEEYGRSSHDSLSNMLITTDEEMRDRLYYGLGTHSEPQERIQSIRVPSWILSDADQETMATLEQQTRARVIHTSDNGYVTDVEVNVEQIRHDQDFNAAQPWKTSLQLSNADPYADEYWRLGTSNTTVGTNARFAY